MLEPDRWAWRPQEEGPQQALVVRLRSFGAPVTCMPNRGRSASTLRRKASIRLMTFAGARSLGMTRSVLGPRAAKASASSTSSDPQRKLAGPLRG